jgi:predicted ATPase
VGFAGSICATFLSALQRHDDHAREPADFPWSLAWLRGLNLLEISAPVTFLVGENGAGKSTLLQRRL